jgi:uncharacterized damage-inducible protein DinB
MYDYPTIVPSEIPRAARAIFQNIVDTYASEVNKVSCVWHQFAEPDLGYRAHPRSSTVAEIMQHELLSERRFFGEFLGTPEPLPDQVRPPVVSVASYSERLVTLARPRLAFLAQQREDWWLEQRPFFDVTRERIWIFWRRILHTAHHRTQLSVYLRLIEKPVPAIYGPTADRTWKGADPTNTVEAASRS